MNNKGCRYTGKGTNGLGGPLCRPFRFCSAGSWGFTPYEHCGCFSCGDLDGLPPLLPLKSPNPSSKLIICVLVLLDWTLCHLCRHPP